MLHSLRYLRHIFFVCIFASLTACVTVEPPKPIVVNGAAGYLEEMEVPRGSVINIAIIDLDTPGVILAQKNFNVAKVPVPFKFLLPAETVKDNVNYGVVAMIENKGRILFQTYTRYPVINNGKNTAVVIMKPVQ